MKSHRKLISSIMVLAIMWSTICSVAFADNNTAKTQQATNTLLKSGFTLEEICELIPEHELASYAEVGPAISLSEVFLKVSVDDETGEVSVVEMEEEDCQEAAAVVQNLRKNMVQQNEPLNTRTIDNDIGGHDDRNTSDGYMRMIVSAYPYLPYPDENGNRRLKVAGQFIWLVVPSERHVNVAALGHSTDVNQLGGSNDFSFEYTADIVSTVNGSIVETYTANKSDIITQCVNDGGTAVSFELYEDGVIGGTVSSNHRIYLSYDVETSETTTSTASVFADYYYQSVGLSFSPSLSFPAGASLSITPSIYYIRMSPNAYKGFYT